MRSIKWIAGLAIVGMIIVLLLYWLREQQPASLLHPLSKEIAVNQIGYTPKAAKIAYSMIETSEFSLLDLANNRIVYRGEVKNRIADINTGKTVYALDFSDYQKPGNYQIILPNGVGSSPFQITPNVYSSIYYQAMRSYELQRCGVPIDDPESHVSHAACHTNPALLLADHSQSLDVSGGWHDAGDFGKYVTNAGVTVAKLMLAADLAPQTMKETKLNITDKGKGMPDTLAEIRVELEWMFKMQRADGAVYHRVSTLQFPGMILPQEDHETQYVYDITTPDTAIFAAAMARAARVYQPYDRDFSARAQKAAVEAWKFLSKSGPILDGSKEATTAYRATTDKEKRTWAALELYLTTRDPLYRQFVNEHAADLLVPPPEIFPAYWLETSSFAMMALVMAPDLNWKLQGEVRRRWIEHADYTVSVIQGTAYHTVLQPEDYQWASAPSSLGYALHLAVANELNPRPEYLFALQKQLDWVLGSNPLSQSFVTGMGLISPKNPHNRYSVASGILVPGLLVGGPNSEATDKVAPKKKGPYSYRDDNRSYATNENAIDYNAPLVVVSAYLHEKQLQSEGSFVHNLLRFLF